MCKCQIAYLLYKQYYGIIIQNPNAGGATMANGEKGKGRSQNQRLKLFYLLDDLLEKYGYETQYDGRASG